MGSDVRHTALEDLGWLLSHVWHLESLNELGQSTQVPTHNLFSMETSRKSRLPEAARPLVT